MRRRLCLALAAWCVLVGSCSPARPVEAVTVTVEAREPIPFLVPSGAVALSVLVRSGRPDTLVQLHTLVLGGRDRVDGGEDDFERMAARHRDHEIIETPSGFVHEVRRGGHSFTYPFAPGWDLPPGEASISFLVDQPDSLEVEILVLRSGERTVLPLTVFTPGVTTLAAATRAGVEQIFAVAGITVRWREGRLPRGISGGLDDIEDWAADSDLSRLAGAVAAAANGGANVVMVDDLPGGASGFATAIPGPHDGSGMAVAVSFRSETETARTVAHEVAHLLGLRHLEDRSAGGVIVRNPISDTVNDAYNLMQFGTNLTEGQIEILRLSPLLQPAAPPGS